jgi:serine/threonine protein kinase
VYFEDLGRQVIGHRTTRQVKMRRVPLASGATFAGFTIVRLLGSGGTGGVYLAEHPRIVRRVAFKLLRADVSAEPDWPRVFHIMGFESGRSVHRLFIDNDPESTGYYAHGSGRLRREPLCATNETGVNRRFSGTDRCVSTFHE